MRFPRVTRLSLRNGFGLPWIGPRQWPAAARALANDRRGWTGPMMFIAGLGVFYPLHLLAAAVPDARWLLGAENLALFTWMVVGLLSMMLSARRSLTVIRKLGYRSLFRPRGWVELARACCSVVILCFAIIVGYLIAGEHAIGARYLFVAAFEVGSFALASFVVYATIANLVRFFVNRHCSGRARASVNFFYSMIGPTCLMTAAVLWWPEQGPLGWRVVVPIALLGAGWMFAGFLANIQRESRCLAGPS